MDIEWEEPPELAHIIGKSKRGRYMDLVVALKGRPETWAKVPLPAGQQARTEGSAKGLAQNIHRGEVAGFTKGEFEAAVHGTEVWARYIGKQGKAEDDKGEGVSDDESPEVLPDAEQPDPAEVRAWAIEQGIPLSKHGRLPASVVERYLVAKRRGDLKMV